MNPQELLTKVIYREMVRFMPAMNPQILRSCAFSAAGLIMRKAIETPLISKEGVLLSTVFKFKEQL